MGDTPKDDRPKPVKTAEDDEPAVYGIVKDEQGLKLTRRGLWTAMGAAAAAATTASCAHSKRTRRVRQMGPRTWTQPCGTPIPPNATCVCDCVAGNAKFGSTTEQVCICDTIEVPVGGSIATGTTCVCNLVCTCDTVGGMGGGGGGGGGGYSPGGHYWYPN